jgi:hypothetical protein
MKISVVCYVRYILVSLYTLRRNTFFNHVVCFLRHVCVSYTHSNSTYTISHTLLAIAISGFGFVVDYRSEIVLFSSLVVDVVP